MGGFQAILWAMVLIAPISEGCYTYEEFATTIFSCVSYGAFGENFTGFGPRLEIDGSFPDLASCDSDGKCHTVDSSQYEAWHNYTSSMQKVSLLVKEMVRNITGSQCFINGLAISDSYCTISVYVKGTKPVCEQPVFTDGGTKAVIVCVSETIYPAGSCSFGIYVTGYADGTVHHTNTPVGSNGDQRLECRFEVTVTGSEANNYKFLSKVKPFVQDVTFPSDAQVVADDYVYLNLQPIALFNTNENGFEFDYPADGKLSIEIPITGNPGPNRVSLSVRYGDRTTSAPLPSDAYELTYAPSVGGAEDGILTLKVTGGLDSSQTSFFTLKADNGVLAESELEYNFSVVVEADGSNQLLLIGAAAGGGALLIIIIIVVVVVIVCRRMSSKKRGLDQASAGYLHPIDVFTVEGSTYPPSSSTYTGPPAYSASEEEDKNRHSYASLESSGSGEYVELDQVDHYTQFDPPVDQKSSFEPPADQNSSFEHPADQNSSFEHPVYHNSSFEHPADQNSSFEHPADQNSSFDPPMSQHLSFYLPVDHPK